MSIKDFVQNKGKASRVLGVDLSMSSLAFGFFEEDSLSSWGKVYIDGNDIADNAGDAYKKFYAICNLNKPELVVFESTVYINNNKVMKNLSMVLGACAAAAKNCGCEVREVPPVTWQTFIGNKVFTKEEKERLARDNPDASTSKLKALMRDERKLRTISFVKETFGQDVDDNDVADAIGVGYYSVNNFTEVL